MCPTKIHGGQKEMDSAGTNVCAPPTTRRCPRMSRMHPRATRRRPGMSCMLSHATHRCPRASHMRPHTTPYRSYKTPCHPYKTPCRPLKIHCQQMVVVGAHAQPVIAQSAICSRSVCNPLSTLLYPLSPSRTCRRKRHGKASACRQAMVGKAE